VLLCFGLPFLTFSCEGPTGTISADMTGWDMAFGGEPTMTATGVLDPEAMRSPDVPEEPIPVQPLVLITFAVVVAGVALSWMSRWIGIPVGVAAALLLIAGQGQVRPSLIADMREANDFPINLPESMFTYRFGYWTSLALLLGIAIYNVVEIVLSRRNPPPG